MKRVYTFGDGKAEGNASMRNLLGGKGANLAEMNLLGMPVPPGFTITTEVCTEYTEKGRDEVVKVIKADVEKAIAHVEELTGKKFNDPANPLLVSVRSGARASMPGMMDTVLNLGMNDATVASLAEKSGNPRFAWDSYRRFVQMYGDVVLGMKPKSKADIDPFEEIMDRVKEEKGVKLDTELDVDDLKNLVTLFKAAVKEYTGKDFPDDAWEQLWGYYAQLGHTIQITGESRQGLQMPSSVQRASTRTCLQTLALAHRSLSLFNKFPEELGMAAHASNLNP